MNVWILSKGDIGEGGSVVAVFDRRANGIKYAKQVMFLGEPTMVCDERVEWCQKDSVEWADLQKFRVLEGNLWKSATVI